MDKKIKKIVSNINFRLLKEFNKELIICNNEDNQDYDEGFRIDVYNVPRDKYIDFIEFSSKVSYEEALAYDVFVDIIPHKQHSAMLLSSIVIDSSKYPDKSIIDLYMPNISDNNILETTIKGPDYKALHDGYKHEGIILQNAGTYNYQMAA